MNADEETRLNNLLHSADESSPWRDRLGNPISPMRWTELHVENYLRIGRDFLGPMEISTVWTGINVGLSDYPTLFETMIFGGPLDGESWRYDDEDAARNNHGLVVELIKDGRILLYSARTIIDGRRRHGAVKWARDWIRHMRKVNS